MPCSVALVWVLLGSMVLTEHILLELHFDDSVAFAMSLFVTISQSLMLFSPDA